MTQESYAGQSPDVERLQQRVAELEQQLVDQEQLQQQLQETKTVLYHCQTRLQLIVDNLPQAVFWKDHNMVYEGCNRYFAKVAGVNDPANIVGKTDFDLAWQREQAEAFRSDDQQVMSTDEPRYHIIEPQLQADGKQAWLDTNKIPLHDAEGNVIGVLGTFEDITERIEMQEALQASEERFRTLVEALTAAVLIHQNGRFRYANSAAEEITGYSRTELQYVTFSDLIHPDYLEVVQQRAEARQRGEPAPSRYEIKIVTKQGTSRWVDINNHLTQFEGQPSIIVTALDVTSYKELEESLRGSEARFREMFEALAVATMVVQGSRYRLLNPAAERLFGYTSEEMQEMNFWDIVHPDYRELVRERGMARQQGQDVTSRYEVQVVRKNGDVCWVELASRGTEFDNRPALIANAFDITERKHAEEERTLWQARIIEAQESALRELSTPLIPLTESTVALPLIGSIDTNRAQQIMETLLQGIADHQADTAILDITGVSNIDTQVANALLQTAQAARLLGAQVILTGIAPSMAQTLVSLGADLGDLVTLSTLRHGIAYAIKRS
jgi:rsbT co-antagonist protein RsbR